MAKSTGLDGVFAISKPVGMSSAQVIRDCQTYFNPSTLFQPMIQEERAARAAESNSDRKRRSRVKRQVQVKIGHGGTLDPLASGVLILGIGKGTKALGDFQKTCTKTYEAVVLFGAATDTYDRAGRVLSRRPYEHVTRDSVEKALDQFRGKYQQMPPLYSALKMNGKPLYEYAREGRPIPREIETREVEVSELELLEWYEPGSHPHRWPPEEAGVAEKSLAERVWNKEHDQANRKTPPPRKLTPEQEAEEERAIAAHISFKEDVEQRQDRLVYDAKPQVLGKRKAADSALDGVADADRPSKSQRQDKSQSARAGGVKEGGGEPMMSGALGAMPKLPMPHNAPKGKGSDLIPPPPDPSAPPPWEGKGPAACKVRMTVTSGFYVRTFCHELGEKVGSAALMSELVRSKQGDYALDGDKTVQYDDLHKGEQIWGPQLERILHDYSRIHFPQPKGAASFKSIYPKEAPKPVADATPSADASNSVTDSGAHPTAQPSSPKKDDDVKEEDVVLEDTKEPVAPSAPAQTAGA